MSYCRISIRTAKLEFKFYQLRKIKEKNQYNFLYPMYYHYIDHKGYDFLEVKDLDNQIEKLFDIPYNMDNLKDLLFKRCNICYPYSADRPWIKCSDCIIHKLSVVIERFD